MATGVPSRMHTYIWICCAVAALYPFENCRFDPLALLRSNEARGIMVDPTVPVVPDSVTILQDQVSWARMPLWTLADTAVFRVLGSHSFLLADTRAVTEHHQFPRHLAEGCTPSGDCWL